MFPFNKARIKNAEYINNPLWAFHRFWLREDCHATVFFLKSNIYYYSAAKSCSKNAPHPSSADRYCILRNRNFVFSQ